MSKKIKPFLKWAGGKTQLLPVIMEKLPDNIGDINRYVEPFIGAGAVFFEFAKHNAFEEYIINDINDKLINLYIAIRNDVENLIDELTVIRNEYFSLDEMVDKEEYFYTKRAEFNTTKELNIRGAALFIFLNKTCFNGLYRENSKGEFNVPFGKAKNPSMFEEEQLREVSKLLNIKDQNGNLRVKIFNKSFEELSEYINNDTFVYFDPPYRPVTVGGFNTYNKSSFNDEDQMKLADFYNQMHQTGARLMLSNSDPKNLDREDEFFDELYRPFNIQRVSANRMINSNAKGRGAITEILVCNYEIVE